MKSKVKSAIRKSVDGLALLTLNAVSITVLSITTSSPSYAQFAGATALMAAIQGALMALGLSIIIIGCWVAGYKIFKKGATWDDISHLILGSFFIGGSVGLGGWVWGILKV